MMEPVREMPHRRNPQLERLLGELNQLLSCAEADVISRFQAPKSPVLLVVGCARSGSTLFSQWLANLGIFAFPSNLLSRFYAAPYIGALIQKMLTDPAYAFQDELVEFQPTRQEYSSTLGKTRGALSPNTFLYFWRRFFHFGEIQHLSDAELEQVDAAGFLAELAALEAAFEKPLAMKAMILNWNLAYLHSIFPRFLFVHIHRDLLYNAQSLLRSRQEFYGTTESWYSYKPPEYPLLKSMSPYAQAAGQVYYTNQAITTQLTAIDPDCWLKVDYASFCATPQETYAQIVSRLGKMGVAVSQPYRGEARFTESNQVHLSAAEVDQVLEAARRFESDVQDGRLQANP